MPSVSEGVGLVEFQAVGGNSSSAAAVSPAWPTHQAGDVGILVVHVQGGQSIGTDPTGSGWTLIGDIAAGTGAGSVHSYAYWKRAASSAEAAINIGDSGDHNQGRIATFRGCKASGSPVEGANTTNYTSATTSPTCPAVTTTGGHRVLVDIVGGGADASGAFASAWANTDSKRRNDPTEIFDSGGLDGSGGRTAAAVTHVRKTGTLAATTLTTASELLALISFALIPEDVTTYPVLEDYTIDGESGGVSTHVFDLPSSAPGDLLLAMCVFRGNISLTGTPSGWSALIDTVITPTTTSFRVGYFTRIADGSEGSDITFTTSGNGRSGSVIVAVSSAGTPVQAGATGNSANPDPPPLDPAGGSAPFLWLASTVITAAANAWPSGYLLIADQGGSGITTPVRVAAAGHYLSSDSENPGTFTRNGGADDWGAYTIAIPRAAVGTGFPFLAPRSRSADPLFSRDLGW